MVHRYDMNAALPCFLKSVALSSCRVQISKHVKIFFPTLLLYRKIPPNLLSEMHLWIMDRAESEIDSLGAWRLDSDSKEYNEKLRS